MYRGGSIVLISRLFDSDRYCKAGKEKITRKKEILVWWFIVKPRKRHLWRWKRWPRSGLYNLGASQPGRNAFGHYLPGKLDAQDSSDLQQRLLSTQSRPNVCICDPFPLTAVLYWRVEVKCWHLWPSETLCPRNDCFIVLSRFGMVGHSLKRGTLWYKKKPISLNCWLRNPCWFCHQYNRAVQKPTGPLNNRSHTREQLARSYASLSDLDLFKKRTKNALRKGRSGRENSGSRGASARSRDLKR